MKKLLTVLTVLGLITIGFASTASVNQAMLVEVYTDTVRFQGGPESCGDPIEVNLPTDAMVTLTMSAGETSSVQCYYWWVIDGDTLEDTRRYIAPSASLNTVHIQYLPAGSHTIEFIMYPGSAGLLTDAIVMQGLFLYEDISAICESPDNDINPHTPQSLIAYTPTITVAGASEVIDISGRRMDCDITSEGTVSVSELPKGTYYVRGGSSTTKVVKTR